MNKMIFFIVFLIVNHFNSQSYKSDSIINNDRTKIKNYENAVNWASMTEKELNLKEIKSKDSDIGFVNTEILVKLFESASIENYYSFTVKIDSKDNKYKISILNPVIRIKMADIDFSELPVSTLKRYRVTLKNLLDIIEKKFEGKMEWDLNRVHSVSVDSDLNLEQKEMLLKIQNSATEYNNKIFINCIKYMQTNNDW